VSLRLAIGAALLGAAMAAAGTAGFALQAGAHPRVERSAAAACADCHMSDYRGARRHEGEKPTTCGVCHTQAGWHPTRTDHEWPLTGAHAKTKCFDCHGAQAPRFHGTPRACVACHRAEYERAPRHPGHFATTCERCHSTAAWKPTLERHDGEEHRPSPLPTATASAEAPPVVTAKPRPSVTPKPRPTARPHPTAMPTSRPRPTATPTTAPTTTLPDAVTGASRRGR
jgi:hypothetical protein